MAILAPNTVHTSADYGLDCRTAIKPKFQKLLAEAEQAGWDVATVTDAIVSLAHSHVATSNADSEREQHLSIERLRQAH